MAEEKFSSLENKIGYVFKDLSLLKKALTHSSYANENKMGKIGCNERLEFLGDAVLEIVCSDYLYKKYPDKPEGVLSKKRASIVCEPTLAECARRIELGNFLLLGKGELVTGGGERDSILSDAFEAVIGAIYLDSNQEEAAKFIYRAVLDGIDEKIKFQDSKTVFQELVQKYTHDPIVYEVIGEEGPEHNRTFTVRVKVGDVILSSGTGKTKQAAGQNAAMHSMNMAKEIFAGKVNG